MEQYQRVAAYGLITRDNQILLARLADSVPHYGGQWTLPGGGIEFAEHPVEAMVREVEEETGLIVESAGLAGVDSFSGVREDRAFHSIRIIFHTKILGGSIRNEIDGTTDECAWCDLDKLDDLNLADLTRTGLTMLNNEEAS